MYLNVMETPKGKIVAVCDKEYIDKTLREGKITLDLKKHASFYKGIVASKEEVEDAIKTADSLNLVGGKCISIAHSLGKINKNMAKRIQGVPHIQMYKI